MSVEGVARPSLSDQATGRRPNRRFDRRRRGDPDLPVTTSLRERRAAALIQVVNNFPVKLAAP